MIIIIGLLHLIVHEVVYSALSINLDLFYKHMYSHIIVLYNICTPI